MKNIKGIFISVVIIIVLAVVAFFTFMQGKSKATEDDNLEYKVNSEIKFLDNKLLSMLNGVNNILLRNYLVTSQEVGQSAEDKDNESSGVSKNSDETQAESDSNSSDNETKFSVFELNNVGVLNTNKDTDWETLKSEIEMLYSSWTTIILDLYKLNVNSEDILKFSDSLNKATIYIKAEDKSGTLSTLTDLYTCLPIYMESYSSDSKEINIQKTKSSLLNAYALVESENWNEINNQISNAELSYLNVLNLSSTRENNDINKTYILLEELKESLNEKDKDIFYIKYKNLLEKLNNL